MLISEKVKNIIQNEIKSQKALLKLVISQETSYGQSYETVKADINKTITYYEKVLKEAA